MRLNDVGKGYVLRVNFSQSALGLAINVQLVLRPMLLLRLVLSGYSNAGVCRITT